MSLILLLRWSEIGILKIWAQFGSFNSLFTSLLRNRLNSFDMFCVRLILKKCSLAHSVSYLSHFLTYFESWKREECDNYIPVFDKFEMVDPALKGFLYTSCQIEGLRYLWGYLYRNMRSFLKSTFSNSFITSRCPPNSCGYMICFRLLMPRALARTLQYWQ